MMNASPRPARRLSVCCSPFLPLATVLLDAQEKSVRPGINKQYENPDFNENVRILEAENREVFSQRKEIVAACKLKPGMVVADIGAGTGLLTRLFAVEVGPKGRVYAVDIAKNFIERIEKDRPGSGAEERNGHRLHADILRIAAKLRRPGLHLRHLPSFRVSPEDHGFRSPGPSSRRPTHPG